MIGDDGRVRIVDFGLAVARQPVCHQQAPPVLSRRPRCQLTRRANPASVSRVRRFIWPRAVRGLAIGRRAQRPVWLLCRAVRGALRQSSLCRQHPRRALLCRTVGRDRRVSRAARARVPDWLHGVVLRGLQQQPEARFPSMAELLEELGRDRQVWRRRGKRLLGMGAVLALSLILGQPWRPKEPDRCAQGTQRIAGSGAHLNMQRCACCCRAGSRRRKICGDAAGAPRSLCHLGWSAMYGEACFAHKRREQSDELFDLRMRCLDQRRAQLQTTVTVLRELSRPEDALDVVIGLEPLSGCADVTDLRAGLQLPEGRIHAPRLSPCGLLLAAWKLRSAPDAIPRPCRKRSRSCSRARSSAMSRSSPKRCFSAARKSRD